MTTPDVYRDAEYLADVSGLSPGLVAGPPSSSGSTIGSNGSYDERMKKIQSTAKVAFIDRLLRDLDILIYCELSALYYMDCSIILFAVRAIVQLIFFTPKAPPFDPTRNQPFVGAIFLSNLFCMLCHTLFAAPEAGEETRGYIHGGLFIDFIGQKAPVPLARLLSMDVLVLLLDLVMLGLVVERVKTVEAQQQQQLINTATGQGSRSNNILSAIINGMGRQDQDHDSEERGVLRGAATVPTTDDQTQVPASRQPSREERAEDHDHDHNTMIDERTELLADPAETGLNLGRSTAAAKDSHPLDRFASGQAVIMDVGLVDVVREQWRYTPATTGRNSLRFANSQQAAAFMARFRDAMNGRSTERNAQTPATATATANNPNPAPDANGIVSA
ncbi:hypothetical protein ASPACDRAFT_79290 [Aspergillus aculeatus ATCC 16872]|uniref:DUF1746 domain-containing protein n=1 Tax=Aspergillus aculeatus (strain ATCC 16872 / CBS 172.66 / WB 5094) TaxID=690307 RepID=A0A1L9WT95_ASPA1|nr:uncharacterized protein ASPACDRAFT_79290 [Aspergillus aculeatus ATCC 16872]OJJ99395.1 hypothetical protein ASPACDRAFT_79290 [Aspergillus aculeatus ATCC 16872]